MLLLSSSARDGAAGRNRINMAMPPAPVIERTPLCRPCKRTQALIPSSTTANKSGQVDGGGKVDQYRPPERGFEWPSQWGSNPIHSRCPPLNPLVLRRVVIQQGPRHNTLITDKLASTICPVWSASSAPVAWPAAGDVVPLFAPTTISVAVKRSSSSEYSTMDKNKTPIIDHRQRCR